MSIQQGNSTALGTTNLADLLERILDKGIVIAGDIKISLVDIELLSIQIRLVICSVDKAQEMGMDWWVNNPALGPGAKKEISEDTLSKIDQRLANLEVALSNAGKVSPEA
ncbi:MAG: gas vesicle protein [Candidatus Electryoneaceae bacterium]|nr:gas vesicle protein [Candidatus Electryoneaceae bacterium]